MPLPRRLNRAVVASRLARALVASVHEVPLRELTAGTRSSPRAAFARKVAMYLTHTVFRVNLAQTGRMFGRDRSTALYAVRTLEEARERDAELDRELDHLTSVLEASRTRRRMRQMLCAIEENGEKANVQAHAA